MSARKPTRSKILAGTFRPDRAPANEVQPEAPVNLRAPVGLSKYAGAFWRRYAPELAELGLLTEVDVAAFHLMAVTWGFVMQAAEHVAMDGMFRRDENGVERRHPGMQVFRDSAQQYKAWAAEFGMTPASRGRIDVPVSGPDPNSEFMALLHRAAERRLNTGQDES